MGGCRYLHQDSGLHCLARPSLPHSRGLAQPRADDQPLLNGLRLVLLADQAHLHRRLAPQKHITATQLSIGSTVGPLLQSCPACPAHACNAAGCRAILTTSD